mgnify:CR=1 FL=1
MGVLEPGRTILKGLKSEPGYQSALPSRLASWRKEICWSALVRVRTCFSSGNSTAQMDLTGAQVAMNRQAMNLGEACQWLYTAFQGPPGFHRLEVLNVRITGKMNSAISLITAFRSMCWVGRRLRLTNARHCCCLEESSIKTLVKAKGGVSGILVFRLLNVALMAFFNGSE